MSITVRNISVSIDGVKSNEFDITLDGAIYHLDDFCLSQNLLSPNRLSFNVHKGPEEDIGETQFSICGYIIGKEITVDLNTEIVSLREEGEKVADICFKGVITSATGNRTRSEFFISVEAVSWEALLVNNPNCKSYENSTLADIVSDVLYDYSDHLDAEINPRFTDIIPYCVQYNETDYQFLQRLAQRYGEWLYCDGEKLIFGNLLPKESVRLAYPSQDIPSYNVNLRMRHVAFNHVASSYNAYDASSKEGLEEMQREYNTLSESVFVASQECFQKPTYQNLISGGFADDDGRESVLGVSTKTQARGEKASMLTYSGTTFCSKVKVGAVLVIADNFITSSVSDEKSQVDQDEILITDVVHSFTKDKIYRNHFNGIPSACDYPPYMDSDVYPVAKSCRAKVKDNEDPNDLGRIRVQFDWQGILDDNMMTPWLRIVHPYAGGGKGFSFIPEVGEEVMVDFEGGNADRPYVKGTLYNGVGNPDVAWIPEKNSKNQIKAIRTRNGHTIEIHDEGENGYIRIYDNKKENYILTLSTDQKLIKLESTGNIELYAKNDIILNAGHDIKSCAGNDINESVGHDRNTTIGRNDSLTVESNQFVCINDNKSEQVTSKLQVSAENIRIEADEKLLQYSKTHHQKASDDMAINAGKRIDIKASLVKVN